MKRGNGAWEEIRQSLEQKTRELHRLVSQPFHSLSLIREEDVPETIGVYLLYDDKFNLPIYAGKAEQVKPKKSGKPSGLCFRIMHNHLGKAGDDNFLQYLAEEIRGDRKQAVQYVKQHCSCQWIELGNAREAVLLEHFAIAVLNPPLNKG